MEAWLRLIPFLALTLVIGCAARPPLEQLEDEASTTGDWTAVERREELVKQRLESTAPGCPKGEVKRCFEEPSGIQCYCVRSAEKRF